MSKTRKLTVGQAVVEFLKHQYVERDGVENRFFEGVFGIFGHGCVAGVGEGLLESPDLKYIMTRNEQASVLMSMAFAKMKNRKATFACVSSIGPGATNMVTGAACATINRLPVLLLPGDIFATRQVAPVLQQLESDRTQDISVNDCFKPVSKYWDRINRPEQLITALPEVMRTLTSPAKTGAVTLCLPQDVQAEAYDFPEELFQKRVWSIPRQRADITALRKAADCIRQSKKPLIIAGGGVLYSEACETLEHFVNQTGIPVAETFAGKGSLLYNHPLNLGAIGATGTPGAVEISKEADLIIGIGTRYSDFTTESKSAFQHPDVKFININVEEFDCFKHGALPLIGDAKVTLDELAELLAGFTTDPHYRQRIKSLSRQWDQRVGEIYAVQGETPVSQAEVIGAVNENIDPEDVMLCAAGSLPGDLHKLWRTRNHKGFHLEYGYSTMGYEVCAGLGAAMACPQRQVWVLVGDGNYLMMNSEIVTAVQEGVKYNIILLDNSGYGSIGALSESVGGQRFGTKYRQRDTNSNQLTGNPIPVDFAMHARSLGATAIEATDIPSLIQAINQARKNHGVTVITIKTDLYKDIDGYGWWEVPISQVSNVDTVQDAYSEYCEEKKKQRYYL